MIDLRLGDSYTLIKDIPDKSIDLIMTDPPYAITNTDSGTGYNDFCRGGAKSIQGMCDELECSGTLTKSIDETILDDFMRVMKVPNIYIWCNGKQIPMYMNYFVNKHNCKFEIIVWWKNNATPLFNNKYLTDIT